MRRGIRFDVSSGFILTLSISAFAGSSDYRGALRDNFLPAIGDIFGIEYGVSS